MYIRILMILLLYGYIAGESDDSNSTRTHLKTDIKPNRNAGSGIPSVHKGLNNKYGTAIIAHVPTISKIVAPVQKDDSNESSDKSSLWEDELADSEIKSPIGFNSDHTNGKIKKSFKNVTSSELQAEGTYHMQQYFQPPVMQNQHYMQRLPSYYNWQQTNYNYNSRNDPCASYSAPHHYLHPNHNNRGFHSQYDPYQAQGTYNIQYYMPPNRQMNQYPSQNPVPRHMWTSMNYNNRQFINPCMPSRPLPPPSTGYQIYLPPNPPKPRTYHPSPPQNIFPYDSYFPKKQTFFPPPPHVYTKIPPPHPPPEPFTPPSVKTYFTTTRKTKVYTPPRTPGTKHPPVTFYTPVTRRTTPRSRTKSHITPPNGCSIWNRNKCHTPTPPPYTPCTKKPNGRKTTPVGPCGTPPTSKPTTWKPITPYTPPPPPPRTKGYTY